MNLRHTRVAKLAVALLAIGACLLLMREAARIGFSRLLTRYALATNSLAATDQAVQLTPSDPEAHRARATVLNRLRRPAEAEASLERATTLRDGHEDLWIELGNTREELGDYEGALSAFDEAVRAAPYYAHTHWQRGNLLLRLGRYDDAFRDLRQAAGSNRKYFPSLIDLAWSLTASAADAEALLQINNDEDRLVFARFLAGKGKGPDVAEQIRLLDARLSAENKEELVRLLAESRQFRDAFELRNGRALPEGIVNGGFEEPVAVNGGYFRWILTDGKAKARLVVDVSERYSGEKSLQISFDGEWYEGMPLLTQTLVLESSRRYRLRFFVKTKHLVTGGPARIVLTSATNDQILGKSEAFPSSTEAWQEMTVEFKTVSDAVGIRLERDRCTQSPCPIFGVVWLDDFALEKL